jgi:hypothetical protein
LTHTFTTLFFLCDCDVLLFVLQEIFMFWLDLGVSGLQLEKVEYLLEDPSRQDEVPRAPPGTTHDEYEFYNHARTVNQPGIKDILAEWKKVILNYTDGTK